MLPVVIMGLGRIGAGYGAREGLPNHLQAALSQQELRVAGLIDPDAGAHAHIADAYPDLVDRLCTDLSDLPRDASAEIIVVCGPTDRHCSMLEQALDRKPCLVVIEKPAADNLATAKRMLAAAAGEGANILVNFHRRFDTRIVRCRQDAPAAPRMIVARYGKGLWNYASHMVDLLMDWYGPIRDVQALAESRPREDDPNLSFRCRMEAGFDAVLIGIDGLAYDQFEMDILGSDGMVEMRAGGSVLRRLAPVDSRHHKGYEALQTRDTDSGTVGGFQELYAHIAAHFDDGADLGGCNLATAVANAAVLEAALVSAERGGVPVRPETPVLHAA